MSAPIGHAVMGMAIARRSGVRSPLGLAAAAVAGNLPDFDIPLGMLLSRDPWKFHRKASHTFGFALTAGALAGLGGVVAAESVAGERDLVADAMRGAVIVGSHVVLDRLPYFPETNIGPSIFGLSLANWVIDSAQWALIAWLIWPRGQADRG